MKKCSNSECTTCQPVRLPPDAFERLRHLPARPYPNETNKGHYLTFQAVYGTETTEKFMSSKTTTTANKGHDIPFQTNKQHASNTNLIIACVYSKKPRVAYSKKKLSKNMKTKFKRQTSELQFVCGTTIEGLVGPDAFTDLHVRGNLRCNATFETIYYSVGYVNCFSHCDATRRLSTGQNEYSMCHSYHSNKNNKTVSRRKSFK